MPKLKFKSQVASRLLGVLAVSLCWSVGGPLSLIATQTLSAGETAFGRCFVAFVGLSPFLILDGIGIFRRLKPSGRLLLMGSGLLLGLHFFLFVSGVAHASLATAVTLVAVEPALVLAVGVIGFKEKLQLVSFFGIVLCLGGVFVISILPHLWSGDQPSAGDRGYGDLCAVLAVVSYGVYYGLNRAFRPHEQRLSAMSSEISRLGPLRRGFSLASIIYVFTALSAGVLMLVSKDSYIQSGETLKGPLVAAVIAAGLIPTVLGHTLSQIVSRTAHPVWVSLMSPGETVCALMLGYVFLGQSMSGFEGLGAGLILMGVGLTAFGEARVTV